MRSDMRSSMVQAGLLNASGSALSPAALSGLAIPGQLNADISWGRAKAGAELLAAEVGVCASFVGEVPTGGLDTFVTLVAFGAYVDAVQNYKEACLAA